MKDPNMRKGRTLGSYLRINSKQARHFPTASTDPCMGISHTDHTDNQLKGVSSRRSSCPSRLSAPCSATASWAHRKRTALGQWGSPPPPNPLTQQKMGPAPMPVVFCWGGTDPWWPGIGCSVCTVSGGHGARDRKEHKRGRKKEWMV